MSNEIITECYNGFAGGNYRFIVLMGETRNKNCLKINDQSMGKMYRIENIWDSDLFKLVRFLESVRYDHREGIIEICNKINKVCNHLFIEVVTEKINGYECIDGIIGWGDFK